MMAPAHSTTSYFCFLLAPFLFLLSSPADAGGFVGVNYGRVANNLPQPAKVVELLKAQGVSEVKLYDADATVLSTLSGTGIGVVVALNNELLASAAARPGFALAWVRKNVAAWHPATQIRAVAVGNEVFASPAAKTLTPALVPAMQNVHAALARLGLDGDVEGAAIVAQVALPPQSAGEGGTVEPAPLVLVHHSPLADPAVRRARPHGVAVLLEPREGPGGVVKSSRSGGRWSRSLLHRRPRRRGLAFHPDRKMIMTMFSPEFQSGIPEFSRISIYA